MQCVLVKFDSQLSVRGVRWGHGGAFRAVRGRLTAAIDQVLSPIAEHCM
jgi:hypothetical protein